MQISHDLRSRGIIDTLSHPQIEEKLDTDFLSFYSGFDPTSASIQIGNLFAVITMKRLQMAGHKPYILVGGATGMIGDPSGKSAERILQSEDIIRYNVECQRKQLERFLDFNGKNAASVVNNYDWFNNFNLLEFLRIVGKRFRITEMLAKDSVKGRMESETGISYTEFTYQILQAYDFAFLYRNHNVKLQIGGSDQWGNITAGTDLIRKMYQAEAYGMTVPLVTDSSGKKFGKSEEGALYLDPKMTSPYKMYQYLLNSDDSKVITYLNYYTFLTLDEIAHLKHQTETMAHLREAQKRLACDVVKLVHGDEGFESAKRATAIFFGEKIENLSLDDLNSIFKDVPSTAVSITELENGFDISALLAMTPLFKSRGEARRSIAQKGVYLNNVLVENETLSITKDQLLEGNNLVLRKGKKNYCLIRFS